MARSKWTPIAEVRYPLVEMYVAERMTRNQFGAPVPSYDPLTYGDYEPKRMDA